MNMNTKYCMKIKESIKTLKNILTGKGLVQCYSACPTYTRCRIVKKKKVMEEIN